MASEGNLLCKWCTIESGLCRINVIANASQQRFGLPATTTEQLAHTLRNVHRACLGTKTPTRWSSIDLRVCRRQLGRSKGPPSPGAPTPCTLEHLASRCLPLLAGVNIVNGADYSGICKRRFHSALMSCVFCEINGDNKECHECLCPWGNGGVYKVLPILNRSKKRGFWCSMLSMVQIANFESRRIIAFLCCNPQTKTFLSWYSVKLTNKTNIFIVGLANLLNPQSFDM